MKNPCKECLIVSICRIACDEFIDYRTLFDPYDVDSWLKNEEVRPRVLERHGHG